MFRTLLLLSLLTLTSAAVANPSEVRHFKGEMPETLAEAYAILDKYNGQLEARLKYDLTPYTMAEIHQMSYSLENALNFIEQELNKTQQNLELVHLASETNDPDTVKEKGKQYLQGSSELMQK